jgi:hypothetical protein
MQEKRPPSGGNSAAAPPEPTGEPVQTPQEARGSGWRWAATLWAIVFLFLSALLVFDLLAGVIRH